VLEIEERRSRPLLEKSALFFSGGIEILGLQMKSRGVTMTN
jgi:hypothetical protein